MSLWFLKILIYGNLGILVEHHFTGFNSLIKKNWKATTCSYLYMGPTYGITGLLLEAIGAFIPWPFYLKAFLYVPIIYGAEALSGFAILNITKLLQKWFGGSNGGIVPWEYAKSRWNMGGLVQLSYLPFWFLLALAFGPISDILHKILRTTASIGW